MSITHIVYLIVPSAWNASKFLHTASNLHIFVRAVQILQTRWYVRRHSSQCFTAHDHTRAAHAKILIEFKR